MDLPKLVSALESACMESLPITSKTRVVEREGWYQTITPSLRHPRFNTVRYSRITDHDVDKWIKQTIDQYKELNLPFRWEVGPSSHPMDLGDRLIDHGLELVDQVYGMAAEPERIRSETKPHVSVEQISRDQLEDWVKTCVSAWDFPEEFSPHFQEELQRGFKDNKQRLRFFLARYKGEPAGVSVLRFTQGIGHLQGSAVIPDFRRQGVYRSLVAHRLQLLSKMKIAFATVECLKDTSAPICRDLGFETVCRFQVYQPKSFSTSDKCGDT